MNVTTMMFKNVFSPLLSSQVQLMAWIALVTLNGWTTPSCHAQNEKATINSSIADDGTGRIIVEARGQLPEAALIYTAKSTATAKVGTQYIEQSVRLTVKVIQGKAKTVSLGVNGSGQVTAVEGDQIKSWSVRREGKGRFLDLQLNEKTSEVRPLVRIRSNKFKLPAEVELTHLTPAKSVGFDSTISIQYDPNVDAAVTTASGFAPLDSDKTTDRFQSSIGGQIKLSLNRSGASPEPVELVETTLKGDLHSNGKSMDFELRGTAHVSEPNAEITILSGNAAVIKVPDDANYRLRLSIENKRPVYKLVFDKKGKFPLSLDFVATLATPGGDARSADFTVAASAVIPLELNGLPEDLEFTRDQESVAPLREKNQWLGFLPATGRARLHWKTARKTGEGKLFFTTTGQVEAKAGAGLLRQDHQIDYQVLQGELTALSVVLNGPGEILDVQGSNIVGWKVTDKGQDRQLDVTLGQPIVGTGQIKVRSQTPLGAFPVRVEGLRLDPVGAIRHSGFLRLSNSGSVRLEPTGLTGLTQLAPDQFPGGAIEARQVFVYRFPAADHTFTVAADRIQPEVNISELVLYELAETDRVIRADIELDIREAPIREWDFGIPSDYSIVAVTGASVADYIAATEVVDGRRNLKVMFAQDVSARQLVSLHLEKNEAAVAGDWDLPRIEYPGAKTVRGDIGVIGAPGFRIAVGDTKLLVDKPLSYFPKPTPHLQQAFRIRQPGWSATMGIELLERNVQSDVFHLYSLSQGTVYGSALINYFVTGAPVSEWKINVPQALGNVIVDGQDVRTWRREDDTLIVSLHQPVIGPYVLLVTFEEKPAETDGEFQAGQITPLQVQGERGYIQVVSPMQVEVKPVSVSEEMLVLDPLELPAEFRLLSTAPSLGTWQYTERPFNLKLNVNWFEPGTTVTQVVEFSEADSRVSQDGELVTNVLYYVKSRGRRTLRIKLPDAPVRLWEVAVNGQPVTARQADDATLIPLPGGTDPNVPVEVRLRLGKPAVYASYPELSLPVVYAPVLKTQWSVAGDEKYVLVPAGGTVTPPVPVLRPSGFESVAKQGVGYLFLVGFLAVVGTLLRNMGGYLRAIGLLALIGSIWVCVACAIAAWSKMGSTSPLQLSLPILSSGEIVELDVRNTPLWRMDLSWMGILSMIAGIAAIVWSFSKDDALQRTLIRTGGILLIGLGVLLQGGGAPWFFGLLAIAIFTLLLIQPGWDAFQDGRRWTRDFLQRRREKKAAAKLENPDSESGVVTATILLFAISLYAGASNCFAVAPKGFEAAAAIKQKWEVAHEDQRLKASGTISVSGQPGDRFVLLKAPAVLTRFEGKGLRLTKKDLPGEGLTYVVTIPISDREAERVNENEDESADDSEDKADNLDEAGDKKDDETEKEAAEPAPLEYLATFEFQLEALKPLEGIPVLTGIAAVQEINFKYDEPGWEVHSAAAVRIESTESEGTEVNVLLAPEKASLVLKPKARDVTTEETQFFVEGSNLYLPGPGVVDGRHRLNVRTSQGQVTELKVMVPDGLTVSAVSGPVGSWQFDADSGELKLEIEPAQSKAFDIAIETQRGLDPLPADVNLAPLKVADAGGEVGLVAIAFGPDAQPEKLEPKTMSAVNLGDFDAGLIPNKQVLHRVYHYGADGGDLAVRVAPVDSEVRVVSKQVLSLGDERVVLGINFSAEITRAGLFQLSFPLPDGLEVESLTGAALHHWSELTEDDQRKIILHLNGKTIGKQVFSLTLTGAAPTEVGDWEIPRFRLNEATRQTGDLIVRPTTGTRLRTVTRQNISETDPREMGGKGQGALAFRLLQTDWNLVLGIEKLDPWVTGQILHDITLREGQTRSTLIGHFNVQNASIRTLQVELPITNKDEIRTLRANGSTVSDFIRTAPNSNIWEIQFKRRVVGRIQFQIEYERRGDRENESEMLRPAAFPQARQLSYHFSVRAGGRLEVEYDKLSQGWQVADWSTVSQKLRQSGNRSAPALTLRAVTPASALKIKALRHSLADALKLRVASGALTTVLSPGGHQLTSVDLTMEVIQRSSLSIGLPAGGELFSIFVNGESVHSIRQGGNANAWQFYILPGIDDRTAQVRFVYSVPGDGLSGLDLTSPELNVPLENIQWNVVAPKGYELVDNDGNLELIRQSQQKNYDRNSYLSKARGKRQVQAQRATQLLEQANQMLQRGEQAKARWALKSVANQYALDAASNEDARVQLENLQRQQAIVGLNTRRQRLYLDNEAEDMAMQDNQQLRQAAAANPILQQDQLNFRPQELSQLLGGNSSEDNAVLQQIAARLVQHQRTTEPAPQAIIISLPEEGSVYTFGRSVQVAENAPLELDLDFGSLLRIHTWRTLALLALLVVMAGTFAFALTRRPKSAE